MLYSPNHFKTSYPSLQQLKVEDIEPIRPQNIRQSAKYSQNHANRFYLRSDVFSRLKEKFTFESSHQFDHIAEVLSKYFEFKVNTIYESVSNLPLPVFACGYCKQTFHTGVEYILHCYDLKCPINHQRSTFFVYFKDDLALVDNQDVQKILIQHNINQEEYIFLKRDQLYFADYKFKRKDSTQNEINTQLRCGRCKRTQFFREVWFQKHCFGMCKSYNLKQSSHQLIIFQNNQPKNEFVQDIKNFWLNINILNLFQNSYIRMKQNSKLPLKKQKGNGQLCSNCGSSFKVKEQFLKHALFDCHSKPNHSSTQLITRRACPFIMLSEPSYKQKCRLIIRQYTKNEQKIKKKLSQVTAKINKRYDEAWKGYENIYFCASCYNLYSDFGLYLAHFNLFCCVVNNQLNSHALFDQFGQQLTKETITSYVEKEDIDFFLRIVPASMNQPKMWYLTELIHKQTGQFYSTSKPSRCGTCGMNKKMPIYNYILHLMRACKNPHHPKNTYQIVYKQKPIILSEIIWFLKNGHYCLKIANIIQQKKVTIQKNEAFPKQQSLGINQQAYCGKCQRWMESPYECYYHYLTECDGINSPNSSHFFHLYQISNKTLLSNLFGIVRFVGSWNNTKVKNNLTIPIETENRTKTVDEVDSQQSEFETKLQQIKTKTIEQKQHSQQKQLFSNSNLQKEQQIVIITQAKQQKSNGDENKNYEHDQYLDIYPNIHYSQSQQKKYYCGKCQLLFKKKSSFIDHIFVCGGFYHPESSHFILSQTKFNDVHWDHLMKLKDFQQNNSKTYPTYADDPKKVICGCGDTNISGLSYHMNNYHLGVIPKGTSHFFLRYKIPKVKNSVCLFLPIEPRPENEKDMFVCPCNPQKKLLYREFANHIIKRHNGKSPVFYMRRNQEHIASEKEN